MKFFTKTEPKVEKYQDNETWFKKKIKIDSYEMEIARKDEEGHDESYFSVRADLGYTSDNFAIVAKKEELKKLAHAILEVVYSE